ncbi:MAG: hypothetical protein JRJ12_13930 [Deltaproteobacteria bacterium]|nr:hypothetical protein [Deltaproteobacteria bacterium]MBW2072186.1 hypothetical protein [Deltaproteobacteria bacterium]
MITAVVSLIMLTGITVKIIFTSSSHEATISTVQPLAMQPSKSAIPQTLENQVVLVAMNFKCACEGCGELPLAECECKMARGALEEKDFIRTKLQEGLGVSKVIELVDRKYGHRIT